MISNLKENGELSKVLVETKKHEVCFLVFQFLKLALILSVVTTKSRGFSAMSPMKTRLCNRMPDEIIYYVFFLKKMPSIQLAMMPLCIVPKHEDL